jgi:hypothetical protein
MLDTELLKYLATMGVGGVIAGLIFMMYRKDMKQNVELWTAQSSNFQQQATVLLEVVRENTRSNEALIRLIENMSGRNLERRH